MRNLLIVLTTGATALAATHGVSVVGIRDAHAASSIVIGNIGTVSNSFAKYSEYAPMQKAVQAWADWTNKHGGVDGHPIRVEVADDENSPAKHLSRVQELVEQKHVVAFVGNPAVDTQPASVRYLEEQGVPAIGGALGNEMWGRSPMLFPHGVAEVQRARMLMQTAALTGNHKFAFFAIPTNPRQIIIKALNSGPAQEAGIQVVFDAVVDNEADNIAACLGAKRAGVEIVTIAAPFEIIASVMEFCGSVGFKPSYVMTGTLTSPQLITAASKNAEGTIGPSRFLPWESDKPAELKTYRQIMNTEGLQLNQATLSGYISARVFDEAIKRIRGEVTPAAVERALRSLNGSDLGGLVAPLGFSTSSSEPNPGATCFWPLIVTNGKWQPMAGKDKVCVNS